MSERTPPSSESILQVNELSVAFKQDDAEKLIVNRISFDIHAGETLALVGESGSGKSLTAHSIMRLLPYPLATHPTGSIMFGNDDLLHFSNKDMRHVRGKKIGMIFQEPMTALNPLHTVERQVGEVIAQHTGLSRGALKAKVLELLHKVQIPNPERRLNSYPHELSGGQRQRVMIAMALANEPDLLIADEPTTALDVTVQREILTLLQQLQSEMNMAILLITHDLGVVRHMAQRVAVMHHGRIVEQNDCDSLFDSPQQEYTQQLLASEPQGRAIEINADEREDILTTSALNVRFPLHKPLFGKPKRFLHAVKNAEINVQRGATLGIVGESGSGKSTLAMAILRLINSDGEISLNGRWIHTLKERQLRPLRRDFQVVFQDPFASLSPRMTVADIVAEGLLVHSHDHPELRDKKVIDVMKEVGLNPDDRHRYPHEFSGGQRQRIAIARALILNPTLIILDEPTSALDRAVQVQVVDLLRKLQQERGLTYLFISHDLKVVKAISHDVLVMRQGDIVEYGPAHKVLETPDQRYTQELLDASFA